MAKDTESSMKTPYMQGQLREIPAGSAYVSPKFETISAAKTARKPRKKLKRKRIKFNKNNSMSAGSLFMTDS